MIQQLLTRRHLLWKSQKLVQTQSKWWLHLLHFKSALKGCLWLTSLINLRLWVWLEERENCSTRTPNLSYLRFHFKMVMMRISTRFTRHQTRKRVNKTVSNNNQCSKFLRMRVTVIRIWTEAKPSKIASNKIFSMGKDSFLIISLTTTIKYQQLKMAFTTLQYLQSLMISVTNKTKICKLNSIIRRLSTKIGLILAKISQTLSTINSSKALLISTVDSRCKVILRSLGLQLCQLQSFRPQTSRLKLIRVCSTWVIALRRLELSISALLTLQVRWIRT